MTASHVQPRPARARRGNLLRLVLGSLVGAACLWGSVSGVDRRVLVDTLSGIRIGWLLAALATVAATVAASALRWQRILQRGSRPTSYGRYLLAAVTGQMLNALLPIRLGEPARAMWISRAEQLPLTRVFASIVVERVADVSMLVVSIGVLLLMLSLPSWTRGSGAVALAASLGTLLLAFVLAQRGAWLLRRMRHPMRILPGRVRMVVLRQSRIAIHELQLLGQWRASGVVWALSAVIVLFAAATNYALFLAFGLSLSPFVALFMFVVLQVGVAPASTPGNVGVFHYLVVLVLAASQVDRTIAMAYAIVLHAIVIVPRIVVGGVAFASASTPVFRPPAWERSALDADVSGSGGR